jgi:hypothetical protein
VKLDFSLYRECRIRVFQNKMLRSISAPQAEISKRWMKYKSAGSIRTLEMHTKFGPET